jgi:hypothetical protein
MADLEKAISGLEHCKTENCSGCPYEDTSAPVGKFGTNELVACKPVLFDDAISLLKTVCKQMNNPTYIVTEGCYSDYHIEGVFLNEENAKKYAALCGGEVEEFVPLDRQDGHQDDEMMRITYRHSTNRIIGIYFSNSAKIYDKDTCFGDDFKFSLKVNSRVGQDVILNGADSELALKVAQDRYAAWKYSNELILVNGIVSTRKNLGTFVKGGEV